MDYYTKKKVATKLVKDLMAEGKEYTAVCLAVQEQYGLSAKYVKETMKMLLAVQNGDE